MKEVLINKCDFCKKTSFNKSVVKKHESICFYNPKTKSCATCLWFSPLYTFHEFDCYPVRCHQKTLKSELEGHNMTLKTNCKNWMNIEIYFINETCENQDMMEVKLLSGDVKYFKALQAQDKI
jgi:hypothetical protein